MSETQESLSKFLSLVLRHRPETIGIHLDEGGWVGVDELITALARHGKALDREGLESLVQRSDKQRFAFSADRTAVRANQGHSVEVDLALPQVEPPALLFHGTVARFLPAIRTEGLIRGSRHHVHLSATRDVAMQVGSRRGPPLVLEVDAEAMSFAGHTFFRSANGVWLTAAVPARFIRFPLPTG